MTTQEDLDLSVPKQDASQRARTKARLRPHRVRRRWFEFHGLKAVFIYLFHGLARHSPYWTVDLVVFVSCILLKASYWIPKNPLRRACVDIAILAARRGYSHNPRAIYRRMFDEAAEVARVLIRVYRKGAEAPVALRFDDDLQQRMQAALRDHGGFIFAVPHNLGAILAAIGVSRLFKLVVVARNPRSDDRTLIGADFAERVELDMIFVRGMTGDDLSDDVLAHVKKGAIVALTMDNLSRQQDGPSASFFDQPARMGAFGARVAAERGIPILPIYVTLKDKVTVVRGAEALIFNTPEAVTEHYTKFFEENFLRDPGSWGYLGDTRWRQLLKAGRQALAAT